MDAFEPFNLVDQGLLPIDGELLCNVDKIKVRGILEGEFNIVSGKQIVKIVSDQLVRSDRESLVEELSRTVGSRLHRVAGDHQEYDQ